MKMQKFLAALLALVMVLTLLPVTAFADDGVAPVDAQENGLYMTKNATLEDDGTYTINLEAYVTGTVKVTTTTTSKPTDIVLVLDMSTSMYEPMVDTAVSNPDTSKPAYYYSFDATTRWRPVYWNGSAWMYTVGGSSYSASGKTLYVSRMGALIEAVNGFINATAEANEGLEQSQQHRISIVSFSNYAYEAAALTYVSGDGTNALLSTVSNLASNAYGATNSSTGMTTAADILSGSGDRATVVVMFTDGQPTTSVQYDDSIAAAAVDASLGMKNEGTKVFTISVLSDANVNDVSGTASSASTTAKMNTYMNAVSSNYPTAKSTSGGYPIQMNDGSTSEGYYKKASNAIELADMFGEIQSTIISGASNFDLGAEAVLKDIMNTGFTLANASASVAVYNYTGNGGWTLGSDSLTATVDKANETVSVTGFSYKDNYVAEATSATSARGKKVVVTITGVIPTDEAVTNDYISTNADISGMYSGETLVEPFLNPTTILTSHAYVVDYAKPFNINKADWMMNNVSTYVQTMGNISGVSISELEMAYGKLVGTTYTPQTMNWDGYDSFYAFGTSTNSTVTAADANANGNLWSKVSIVPANNVYYEDDFITSMNGEVVNENVVGFEYGAGWTVETTGETGNGESADTSVHGGWQNADLADDTGFSDGSAHKVTSKAKASFTFTGTGVDVYTRTNASSGGIRATLYKWNEETSSWETLMIQYMNNLAESGDYYQIPTLSLHSVTGTDLAGNSVDEPLTYGKYKVDLIAYVIDGNATYYLDGIRIYNPAQEAENDTEDTTVSDAYEEDNALQAVFTEVRDILIDNGNFNAGDETVKGAVFIDSVDVTDEETQTSVTTQEIGTYVDYGPKNEVYLAKDQMIAIAVNETEGAHYFVGLKAPAGATTAKITNGSDTSELSIGHSTDLYYEVVPNADGLIIIENTTDNLLSVTKLQTTGVGGSDVVRVNALMLMSYAEEFDTLPVVAYSLRAPKPEVEEPEVTEPEATEPDVTEPEETEPETPDVEIEIENPEPAPEQKPEQKPNTGIRDLVKKIFGFLSKWF